MPSSDIPKILVVEDDDIVRMLMVDVLEELDFSVLEAEGWDTAVSVLESDVSVDLLVTDVGLSDAANRDGIELAKLARRLRPGIPVLVASGYGNTLDLPEGTQMLSKPFNIDTLRETVSALQAKRAG
jgi:CheY-like chemotaxis protein